MKTPLLLLCPVALLSSAAWAAPVCVNNGTLDTYAALGAGGCTVGGALFSNFTVSPGSSASGITVNTVTTSTNEGLSFMGPFAAAPGSSVDVGIGFVVSAPGMTGDTLAMTGFNATGGGSIIVAESLCVGSAYASDGTCSGSGGVKTLGVSSNATSTVPSASVSFAAVNTLGVVKNIIVNGGPSGVSGAAGVSFVINTFPTGGSAGPEAVPEPASFLLIGSALLGLGVLTRRHTRSS